MKVKLNTHDGVALEIEIENYNSVEMNEKLNNPELNTVAIGNVVISRINVKSIVPV